MTVAERIVLRYLLAKYNLRVVPSDKVNNNSFNFNKREINYVTKI
jgi:hypothetical protein